jgi:hypothetical protein
VLDTLFAFAREGVSGVNIHTLPSAAYRLFTIDNTDGRWSASVLPEYYGLLMFEQAAPTGSELLRVQASRAPHLAVWATQTPDGDTRVVLINKSDRQGTVVSVRVPATGTATGETLRAPSLEATGGVTLGGTEIADGTTTGMLEAVPQTQPLRRRNGVYTVALPAASALLLTVAPPATRVSAARAGATSLRGARAAGARTRARGVPRW